MKKLRTVIRAIFKKIGTFFDWFLSGRWSSMIIALICGFSASQAIWDHEWVFSIINGGLSAWNFITFGLRSRRQEKHTVLSLLPPATMEDIDNRFMAAIRKLEQDPSQKNVGEVITDLRGIVKDLSV